MIIYTEQSTLYDHYYPEVAEYEFFGKNYSFIVLTGYTRENTYPIREHIKRDQSCQE